MKLNCVLWAWRAKRELRRSGLAGKGREVYDWKRATRSEGGIFHVGIGVRDRRTGHMRMWSFKPKHPRRHAWWELPVFFEGEIVEGDTFIPVDLPPLPRWKVWLGHALAGALLVAAGQVAQVVVA